ncbi:hypothetical protein D3C76_992670 [compost metagenome]
MIAKIIQALQVDEKLVHFLFQYTELGLSQHRLSIRMASICFCDNIESLAGFRRTGQSYVMMVKILSAAYDSVNIHGRFRSEIEHGDKPLPLSFLRNDDGPCEPSIFPVISPTLARVHTPERLSVHLMNEQLLLRRKTGKTDW